MDCSNIDLYYNPLYATLLYTDFDDTQICVIQMILIRNYTPNIKYTLSNIAKWQWLYAGFIQQFVPAQQQRITEFWL